MQHQLLRPLRKEWRVMIPTMSSAFPRICTFEGPKVQLAAVVDD